MSIETGRPAGVGEDTDARELTHFGYRPTLKRTMGGFSSFAVSFSFISITTGIFGNYSFGIEEGGPRFVWTWLLVAVGTTLGPTGRYGPNAYWPLASGTG